MQPIDKKALQKSRKTAVFLGLAVVIVMLVILYMVQKTLHDPNEQLIALGLSTFVLVIFIIIIGLYRKKKIRLQQ